MISYPKDKQCWMRGCKRLAKHEITYNYQKVKVCDGDKHNDGKHWHWTVEQGNVVCVKKNCKRK